MIALDDVVLRDDLDPRLGERDDDLIQQYADIFDALPPIEINQRHELIDGWHRVRAAERAERTEIAYVVIETESDEDLRDRMYAANLRHGVQYTREQKRAYGVRLHGRELPAKEIAMLSGVGVSTVYRWTRELRDREREEREREIERLRAEGQTQQEIASELGIDQSTVARNMQDSQIGISHKELESEADPALEDEEEETGETPEADEGEIPETEETSGEVEDISEQDPQLETDETSAAEEEPATPDPEPPPLEEIPDHILETARAIMGAFTETRPDDYVARLEASASEWMTVTDDSLSNELERELLTSAAAMCLWQEWMVWYQGENASTFTDNFGKIGPVFVRGQAGQWRIVSRLRSILKRLWA